MNFKFINPHNVEWLVPGWMCPSFPLARGIEDTIQDMPEGYRPNLKKMPCVAFHVAMAMEESLVEDTLYPRGLNMIPGGYAGLKYLHSLGLRKTTAWDKDIVVERLPRLETIDGRPNPLCAARWQTDQNFVNKVICGHGARLTVEHVREARLMSDKGLTGFAIAASLCRSEDQIMRLLRGKTYTRVA